jgi:hypothetical protein
MSVATLAAKPPSRRMLERMGMTPEEELELLIREQQKDDTHFIDRPANEVSLNAPWRIGGELREVGDLLQVDEDGVVSFSEALGHRSPLADTRMIPHGTLGGYTNHRCHCGPCRQANTEYRRKKRAEKGSGS